MTLPYTGFCPNGNWTAKVADDSNGEFVEDAQYDFYFAHYHYVYCYVPGEHGDRGPFVNPMTGLYEPAGATSSTVPTNATNYALQHAIGATTAAMNKTAGMNATTAAAGMNKTAGMNATSSATAALNYTGSAMNATGVNTDKPHATMNQPGGSSQEPVINNPVAKQNDRYYEGLNWWGVCTNPLLRSYITQSCDVLVTPDKNALTSKGKVALEGILCPRGPSIVTTLELFYGTIPQKLKNDLGVACGWH